MKRHRLDDPPKKHKEPDWVREYPYPVGTIVDYGVGRGRVQKTPSPYSIVVNNETMSISLVREVLKKV